MKLNVICIKFHKNVVSSPLVTLRDLSYKIIVTRPSNVLTKDIIISTHRYKIYYGLWP